MVTITSCLSILEVMIIFISISNILATFVYQAINYPFSDIKIINSQHKENNDMPRSLAKEDT